MSINIKHIIIFLLFIYKSIQVEGFCFCYILLFVLLQHFEFMNKF